MEMLRGPREKTSDLHEPAAGRPLFLFSPFIRPRRTKVSGSARFPCSYRCCRCPGPCPLAVGLLVKKTCKRLSERASSTGENVGSNLSRERDMILGTLTGDFINRVNRETTMPLSRSSTIHRFSIFMRASEQNSSRDRTLYLAELAIEYLIIVVPSLGHCSLTIFNQVTHGGKRSKLGNFPPKCEGLYN